MKDKKNILITLKSEKIISILAICCCAYIFIAFKDGNNILTLLKQDSILKYVNISDGLKSIASNMTLSMKVLSVASIIIYAFNGNRIIRDAKISPIINVMLDLLILISLGMYSLIYCGLIKVPIENDFKFSFYLICILIMIIVLAMHSFIVIYKKNFSNENKAISVIEGVMVTCLTIFTLLMLGKEIVIAANIYSDIGTVLEKGLTVNQAIEEEFGNYRYDGVVTQTDLYYIDYNRADNIYYINKLDEHGNVTEIFASSSPIEDIFYHNGKLYVMSYSQGGNVNSIDVTTGEEAVVLNKKGLFKYGIVDGNMYYLLDEYGEDGNKNLKIYLASIDDIEDINTAELFFNRLRTMPGEIMLFNTNAFYGTFIYGDEKYLDKNCVASVHSTDQEYKGYDYGIKSQHDERLSEIPGLLVISHENVELNKINSVTAYNVGNDNLYYAIAKDNNYELYRADISGDNSECILDGTGDRIERIFITPKSIVVIYVSGEIRKI